MVSTKTNSSKTKKSRSRFGCVNCKKMKIKCDEIKPQCLNCCKSKKYFNKCDYSIKLSWGGRPYKNTKRKKAMENCGYSFNNTNFSNMVPTNFKPQFINENNINNENDTPIIRRKVPVKKMNFGFVDEYKSISKEYHDLTNEIFMENNNKHLLSNDDDNVTTKRQKINDGFKISHTDSETSTTSSNFDSASRTSVSSFSDNDCFQKQNSPSNCDDLMAITDAFRYDKPTFTSITGIPAEKEQIESFIINDLDVDNNSDNIYLQNFLVESDENNFDIDNNHQKIQPGLQNLLLVMKSKVGRILPQFSDSIIINLISQINFPSLILEEEKTASQFTHQKDFRKNSNDSNNLDNFFNLEIKKDNLMNIDNFFTDLNMSDFNMFDLENSALMEPTNNNNNITIPFAESDDFWSNFTNEGMYEDASFEIKNKEDDCVLYTDIYSVAPIGVILLDSKPDNDDEDLFNKDIITIYDKDNFKFHYYYYTNNSRIPISIVPLPDLLRNVKYYRELFDFYIHYTADSLINYKDEFFSCLDNDVLVKKNPFKYQLPAIGFQNPGILCTMLAISAALKQFKSNFENLTINDVGNLRKSNRSFSNLDIHKNSLSRYNYHKPIIQNLVSRAFKEMIGSLTSNKNLDSCIIMIYLINYLEKITCKKLCWKLLDYDKDLVFKGFSKLNDVSQLLSNNDNIRNYNSAMDEFLDYLLTWYNTSLIIDGCIFKTPKVEEDSLKTILLDDSTDIPEKLSNQLFGLDISILSDCYKIMQISKEKITLISKFKSLLNENILQSSEILNLNSGIVEEALLIKKSIIKKLNSILKRFDELILTKNDDNFKKSVNILKITNKLFTYSMLLILYRRVIMLPRQSDITQGFSKQIIKLSLELLELTESLNSNKNHLTMFNGCFYFSVVCGALENLDLELKKEVLLKIFELSKKNFNLNSFLAFEIIQESYENGLPLSEIVHKRDISVYFA